MQVYMCAAAAPKGTRKSRKSRLSKKKHTQCQKFVRARARARDYIGIHRARRTPVITKSRFRIRERIARKSRELRNARSELLHPIIFMARLSELRRGLLKLSSMTMMRGFCRFFLCSKQLANSGFYECHTFCNCLNVILRNAQIKSFI